MKFEKINVFGNADSKLVLIHGLAGLFNSWEYNVGYLSKFFSIHEIILPDYADSDNGYGIDDFVIYVLDYLNKEKLKSVFILGNSVGGQIAAIIAAKFPNLVSKLILISSAGFFDESEQHEKLIIRSPSLENIIKVMQNIFYDKNKCDSNLVNNVCKDYSNRKRLLGFLRTARRTKVYNISNLITRIQVPTLIVWGLNDNIIPINIAYKFYHLIKNSSLVIFSKCGHAPQIEYSKRFNSLAKQFLLSN